MKHPFINDLSEKSLEELQSKITEINNKLTFAYRTSNRPLINQLLMILESYRDEYNTKMNDLIKKQKIDSKISIEQNGKLK